MKSTKIIISGGAGFIGTNLINTLLKNKKNEIICIDNFSSGLKSNLSQFLDFNNFSLITHDITNPIFIEENIHEIYNLACIASPNKYKQVPLKTIKTNTQGLFNLLDIAKENNAKFLQTSTSEIYGEPSCQIQNETYNGNVSTLSTRACYDESKRISETICYNYYKEYNLDIKIARIFNTYGPYMSKNDGRVVSNFINQALQNEPLTIYGDGTQTRSFCYVDDTVRGLIKLMSSKTHTPVNIGNPNEINMIELSELISELVGTPPKTIHMDKVSDDPTHRCPDISKAKNDLNWQPQVSLKEGLVQTIKYYQEELN